MREKYCFFFTPVYTGSGAHPVQQVPDSFPGVKQQKRGVDHPPPSSVDVKERVELYQYSVRVSAWPVTGWPLLLHDS